MRLLVAFLICFLLIIGTNQIAYCPDPGSYGSESYKGSGGYKGGGYSGSENYKSSGAGKVKPDAPTYSTTLGQELIDLEAAYKKGIINEAEYKELKKIIIEQRKNK